MDFLRIFKNKKPIIGMLHLKGDSSDDIESRFEKELATYIKCGVDGVIVETYYGSYSSLVRALEYINRNNINIPFGINCLNVDTMGFYLANKYNADFVQVDSVVGHVKPRDEETLQAFFDLERSKYKGCLIGGVRFKYQPMLSNRSLKEDLEIAKGRCDGICVTGDRTGEETSIDKIKEFREDLGDFPLIIAAGVTANNIEESFKYGDGTIVGSYFKDNYKDDGELDEKHIKELLSVVNGIRGEL